jgi:hypothetical protein
LAPGPQRWVHRHVVVEPARLAGPMIVVAGLPQPGSPRLAGLAGLAGLMVFTVKLTAC